MLRNAVPSLLQHVRRLAVTSSSDEQLLADFLARRSDEAFAALLGRHGPMVLNVCRRILHDTHLAEDVFQATFLVLADRAAAIQRKASLAGFLHGVAYRLAVRARRRPTQNLPAAVCDRDATPAEGLAWKEMLGILDHELGQLSDRYRAPLVICYLEGRTQDEAAQQLGWSLNTLRRRLAHGRQLLEARLRGRGVTLPAVMAGMLAAGAVGVPGRLRASTLAAVAARLAGGLTASVTVVSAARKAINLTLSASGKKVGALVAVAALGVAVCLASCWSLHADQDPAGEPTPPADAARRGDPVDDPLPARGAVRLGTARYRHGSRIESFAVSADGRLAAASSGWRSFAPARVFDLTDGRCLHSLPHEYERGIEAVGLSPDGKILAVKDDKFLSFLDAVTGKEIRKLKYLSDAGGGRSVTTWLTFSPDGKQIAATLMGDATQLIDVETATATRTFAAASACVFSPDGKLMATAGYDVDDGVYPVRIWEVGSGKERARFPAVRFPSGNGMKRALAFSPDGATLAGGGWGDARLRLWETATGKEPTEFPKLAEDLVSVAFAPDGKTIAAAADNVYLYDPVTGKERFRIERRARGLAFSRDGSVLTGAVSGAIYRWDAATGRQLTPSSAQDGPVELILVSADGRSVFTTDADGELYVWDAAGGKSPRRIAGGVERGVVASPDGRFLAWAVAIDARNPDPTGAKWYQTASRVRLYDVAARRVIDRLPGFAGQAAVVAFLPDGKSLLTLGGGFGDATVRLLDVETGKERRSFAIATAPDPKLPVPRRGNAGMPVYTSRRAALSPDGKTLAVGPDWEDNLSVNEEQPVRLWDVATGKAGPELNKLTNGPDARDEAGTGKVWESGLIRVNRKMTSSAGRTFSPDGRFVADWAENPFGRSRMDHVSVWDAASGRVVASLAAGPRSSATNAAFAPDGRTFATATVDGVVRLWEVATWKLRTEFRGHRDRVTALAFGPDGRLYTGGLDTVVLGWDVRPAGDVKRGTFDGAWKALVESDAKAAYQAQGRFLAEPRKGVEWIAARLQPVSAPDAAVVKRLLADLDSEDFATRERATAELKEHGPFAAAGLREVVAKSASNEARRRASRILEEMASGVTPAGELRAVRVVEALEWIATDEARAHLAELAKGAPEARLTREAVDAGKRLDGRKPAAP